MRKAVVLVAVAVVGAGVLSPAEAATKKYAISSITMTVTDTKARTVNRQSVIDVSNGHEKDTVKLTGKVTGGPVKGRSIRVYAYNTNDGNARRSLGTRTLSSSGTFSVTDHPPRGGRWRYEFIKSTSGSYRGVTRNAYLDAFHWTYLYELTDVTQTPGVEHFSKNDPSTTDLREYVGPPISSNPQGTRWTDELVVVGGTTVRFPVDRYRCKKIALKTGVSNSSKPGIEPGTITFSRGTKLLRTIVSTQGEAPWDTEATPETSAARAFKDSLRTGSGDLVISVVGDPVTPPPPVEEGEPTPAPETPQDIRFVVGNGKLFCTFPSVNLDL